MKDTSVPQQIQSTALMTHRHHYFTSALVPTRMLCYFEIKLSDWMLLAV